MSPSQHVSIPLSVAQQLQSEAEKLGINLPGTIRYAPTINVTMPIRMLALELGRLLATRNLFLRGEDVVTVDEETGEIRPMTPKRLPGWAEEFCAFEAPGARRVRDSLSVDDAAQILETDVFRGCLRPLTAVHQMVLPVMRPLKEGQAVADVEFLEPGYDVPSGIYTVETIKYDRAWTLQQAQIFALEKHIGFPWNRTEKDEKWGDSSVWLAYNRSFSVHMMAVLGQYCKAMFPPGSLFPIMAYFANKPGTGKTRLAEIAVSAVHGFAASTGAPKDDEKMDVKLETVAQSMSSYLILDDIGGGLRSNPLNRFTTESWHNGRKFHSNSEMFRVPNVTQVFVTANDLPTSEDIDRRALIVELFLDTEVKGRKFPFVITPQWLALPETRASFLAMCCAFVRNWLEHGRILHSSPLETYEEWTSIIGGMVIDGELADPLQAREGVVGGSVDEDEFKQLLIEAASDLMSSCLLTRARLVEIARKNGLLENVVGAQGSADPDDSANRKFGRRMQRWRGQKLKDKSGRVFQFGHKKMKTGAGYPVTFFDANGVAAPAAASAAPGDPVGDDERTGLDFVQDVEGDGYIEPPDA